MKTIFTALALLLTASLTQAAGAEAAKFQALGNPQPTGDSEKIEVLELFWYGCPHCYQLEPEINAWAAKQADDVVFVRIPAILGPSWEVHARAFYTAELLGVTDKIHEPLFDRLHKDRKPVRTPDDVKAFFIEQGVSEADFDKTFNSFAVITKTNRARQARSNYGITGVPTLVVNGKYRTTAQLAGGNKKMLQVVDQLVEQERSGAADEQAAAAQ